MGACLGRENVGIRDNTQSAFKDQEIAIRTQNMKMNFLDCLENGQFLVYLNIITAFFACPVLE